MSMTEREAIELLNSFYEMDEMYVAAQIAIKALEEIQEFRKQGITIEKALDTMCDLAGAENLIEQYRAIGTVEEFKALKEKNEPYKPQEYEDRYYACKCDNILLPKWRKYPTELMPKSEGLPHCLACGQKLDWS